MTVAGILFLSGILIGLFGSSFGLIAASLVTTLVMIVLWAMRGELGLFSILIGLGYLFALQSGFLVGGYVRTQERS
jgi:hypothetical protein